MKYCCFLLMLLPLSASAQSTDTLRHSISLWGEAGGFSNGATSVSTFGLQYEKKVNRHFSYHINAGSAHYSNTTSDGLLVIAGDSAITRRISDNIHLYTVGFGVETQRQFYRKLYFFAGLEMRIGYGHGTADTSFALEYNAPFITPNGATIGTEPVTTVSGDENMVYAGLTPYAGLKLVFRRWELGTSFMNYLNYTSIQPKGGTTTSSVSFDLSNLAQRVFLSYKF